MKTNLTSFDVVIVGFGPIGQFVVNLLKPYNLKIAVIEKLPSINSSPRANAIDDEIMRGMSRLDTFKEFKNKTSVPDFIEFS